jgi:TolB-like protein/Tfp pilus assembly protein PilF
MNQDDVNFGPFLLDVRRRQLRCGEVPVKVGRLEIDILCVLAQAKGGVVTKDEILAKVWPRRVVEDNAIQVHISALRKALDQADNAQTYVVTVPGRGYRLVGMEPRITLHENDTEDQDTENQIDPVVLGTSIAVMPFQNLSNEKEYEYFADGMVEDLVTGLSRIKSLFVIARGSSFIYKEQLVDVKQVGRELGVRYVVEGSVRKAGDHFHVAVQLIEAQTGAHLWAESYDRPLDNIFTVQDDITMSVVGAIEPQLRKIEIERIKRKRPNNLDAYDLLLRAHSIHDLTPEAAAKTIPLLENALVLEPDYACAHAHLAHSYHIRFRLGGWNEQDCKTAIQHAHAAIACGSDGATTLATAGLVILLDEHDVATAFDLFDHALAISRSNVVALSYSAYALAWMGNSELAIERAQRALHISPIDITHSYMALSVAHFNSKRYAEARDAAQRANESNPQFSIPYILLAVSLVRLGHLEEAKATANRVVALDPSFTRQGASTSYRGQNHG